MPVTIKVTPEFDRHAAAEVVLDIKEAVRQGVREALTEAVGEVTFLLSITDEERQAVAAYREQKRLDRKGAHSLVVKHLNGGE